MLNETIIPKDIPIKTAKNTSRAYQSQKLQQEVKKETEPLKVVAETKPKEKKQKETKIAYEKMPKELVLNEAKGTIELIVTPEISEAAVRGILEAIHLLAPKSFHEPTDKHVNSLKQPAHVVLDRWVKRIDLLKYLPEIVLAAGFIGVLRDMKVTESEVKK